MFKSFHSDSPCRTRTSLCEYNCVLLLLLLLLLLLIVVGEVKDGIAECRRPEEDCGATKAEDVAAIVAESRMRSDDDNCMLIVFLVYAIC